MHQFDIAFLYICRKIIGMGKKEFNMDRYLFLDFDGVLNTGKYAKRMAQEGIDPFDEFGAIFDPEAIENLKHIVELTGGKIVLSTTWRNEG